MRSTGLFEGGTGGVRIGIVTDNEDPEDLGRVKLRFPWREVDDESPWARIAAPMAGDSCGAYFLPEIGDEVLVAFAGGDVHRPFVLGSLWNGSATPPRRNADGENAVRTIESPHGHRVVLDDSEDAPEVRVETSDGHRLRLGADRLTLEDASGDNSVEIDPDSDAVSIAADERIDLSAPTVAITGDESVVVEGTRDVTVESDSTVDLTSRGQFRVSSVGLLKLNASGPLTASGSLIKLN